MLERRVSKSEVLFASNERGECEIVLAGCGVDKVVVYDDYDELLAGFSRQKRRMGFSGCEPQFFPLPEIPSHMRSKLTLCQYGNALSEVGLSKAEQRTAERHLALFETTDDGRIILEFKPSFDDFDSMADRLRDFKRHVERLHGAFISAGSTDREWRCSKLENVRSLELSDGVATIAFYEGGNGHAEEGQVVGGLESLGWHIEGWQRPSVTELGGALFEGDLGFAVDELAYLNQYLSFSERSADGVVMTVREGCDRIHEFDYRLRSVGIVLDVPEVAASNGRGR